MFKVGDKVKFTPEIDRYMLFYYNKITPNNIYTVTAVTKHSAVIEIYNEYTKTFNHNQLILVSSMPKNYSGKQCDFIQIRRKTCT